MSWSCHFAVYWTYSLLHQCFMPNRYISLFKMYLTLLTSQRGALATDARAGVSNSRPGGQLRPTGWYFVAPYLTSKFSVSAARTLFSNAHFCWVLPHFYLFFITYGLPWKVSWQLPARSEEPFMFRRNIHVEELLIIKIEKIVLLFLEYVKPFFVEYLMRPSLTQTLPPPAPR